MATQVPSKRNRGPWILVGVLGCLALCLFFVLVAGGLYAVVSRNQPTPVARELPTMIAPATPMPLATTARPSPIATPTTSRTGRFAYIASDPTGDPFKKDAIYLINADGSQRTLVTDKLSVSNNLFWSPDGTRMVFDARDDTNVSSIYVVNADGTGLNRLTNCSPSVCASPAWSPDGKRIAFQFDFFEPGKPYQGPQLYLMNPDGSQQTLLAGNVGGIIRQLAWSPDGKRIALQDIRRCIRVVSTRDGSVSGPLTGCSGADDAQYPAWSPDSKQIAFIYTSKTGTPFALYAMNADGSQQTRLTADLELGQTPPVWSPDGRRIAFSYASKNTRAIGLINPDGSGMMRLTPDDLNAGEPAWSPDGKRIAFSVVTQGQMKTDIYVMNADGSEVTRLTNVPLSAHSPAWQPISR